MGKKIWKICSSIVSTTMMIVLVVMVFLVISSKASGGEPQLFGYQFKTVLSGSMEPTFKTGSVIAVEMVEDPSTMKKGDIVTFMEDSNKIVTHRIDEVVQSGGQEFYRTKGDNNKDADSDLVIPSNVVAQYTGVTIPYLGYFLDFAKSPKGTALLLIVPGVLLLLYSIVVIMQAVKEIERTAKRHKEQLEDPTRTSA